MQTPRLAWSIGVLPTRGVSRTQIAFFAVAALAASLVVVSPQILPVPAASSAGAEERAVEGYGDLPISFEPNVGQAPNRYDFVARGQSFGMAIQATGATLALGTKEAQDIVRLDLLGADRSARPRALESLPGVVNYFIGNDPSKWRSDVSTFGRVSYREILPGIDVTYYGTNAGTLEYDFVVAPGADPTDIRVGFSGASDVALRDGSLVITTASGAVTQEAPVLYQSIAGRRVPVDGRFSLAGDEVGFEVGAYDHQHPLVIDPTLTYSTYLGGSGYENVYGIAVDGSGAAYVTGYTTSTNFPMQSPFQGSSAGTPDAFVAKLNATGSGLIYSTYLGGSGTDLGFGIAVDGSGAAYVTGSTTSTNFPTQSPFQGSNAGSTDAFVTKLNATGSALIYSTYLGGPSSAGGPGDDLGYGIAVDGSGAAYVAGSTTSTTFPTQSPFQGSNAGSTDAFVTKLSATGSALVYSTYLGGSNDDFARGIAVDGSGAAYVTGSTTSTTFPTQSPFQGSNAGSTDAFVTKLSATGSALVYSTYLGGSNDDFARGIAVDGSGAAYVTGSTTSTNFPTQSPFQGSNAGSTDAFVTKLNATGSALIYSTYLGGSGPDLGYGIAVDGSGVAYVAGITVSTNFPTQAPFQGTFAGNSDAFVTTLTATGSALICSTYLGGSSGDVGRGIAVDGSSAAYVAGGTVSTNFPTTQPPGPAPFQGSKAGSDDAFVTKLCRETSADLSLVKSDSTDPIAAGQTLTYTLTVQNAGPDTATGVTITDTLPAGVSFVSASAGCTHVSGTVTCNVANIASGASAQVQIQVTPNQVGTITNTASVAANEADPQTADNQDSEQTTVQAPVTCGGQAVTIQVTAPNQTTSGTSAADVINGTTGIDTIYGLGGNDTICGLGGNDWLHGDDDDDRIFGGNGMDVLWGNIGDDKLFGAGGLDELWGNIGDDKLFGGNGMDDLTGGAGDDTLKGNDGDDASLNGGAGNDKLFAGAGNDWLFGDAGNDKLFGGGDDDKLSGGADTDDCDGGAGSNLDIGTPLCETSTNIP